MKIKLLSLLIIIIPIVSAANEDLIPYVSPGVRIGWNFKRAITIDTKLSLGLLMGNNNLNFYNVTAGIRGAIRNYSHTDYNTFYHFDVQMGRNGIALFDRASPLIYGGGLGIGFNKNGAFPYMTLFSGMFLFTSIDMFYSKTRGINTDLGIQGVLPIPLKKIDVGSLGG